MISRRILLTLVTLGCTLPLVLAILLGSGRLLLAMGDASGARFADLLGLIVAILCMSNFMFLILSLGINAVVATPHTEAAPMSESPARPTADTSSDDERHEALSASPTPEHPASE